MNLPILIIEDSDPFFFTLNMAFRIVGVENPIFRCETGEEAIAYLFRKGIYAERNRSPRPGLIILDLTLPGTDGKNVLKIIKNDGNLKTIPVIILTSSMREEDLTDCYLEGANFFISKPLEAEDITEMIRKIKSYLLQTATLPRGNST